MELPPPPWFAELFPVLLTGRDLPAGRVTEAVRDLVAGRVDEARAAAFLTALRMKGESAPEIAAAALVLREQMVRLVPVSGPVLDTCGTGGDESGTFNISTAAALVAAGAGIPVVKHGNRAVSSKSGSADVLRELGVPVDAGPEWAQKCLDRVGFAFCFAPHFHRGMAHVAALRRKLGVRTVFNLLGPLANPANAPYQLLGVGKPELLDPLAGALAELDTRQAVLVCSFDGLDEVSLAAPTMVRVVRGDEYEAREWGPDEFGLGAVPVRAIQAADPADSAATIRRVLDGEDGPARRIVLANAAAALWAAEAVRTLREGVERADAAIKSGHARAVLEALKSGPRLTRATSPRTNSMPRKVIIIADPGIDTAFAVALALNDPALEVVGLLPTAGNVSADQATANVHTLIDVLDPPKWPRLAAALPARYETDGLALHGPGGLGGVSFPTATRHTLHPADKVLVELAHEHPRQATVICLGPLTTLATALDRDPGLPAALDQTILVGGAWRVPGNAGPTAEFHFYLDPDAGKRVLHAELNPLLIPLDMTRRLTFSPSDLLELPNPDSRTCQFLRQIIPFGIRASSNLYGIEGFHLKDVLGVVAASVPGCVTSETYHVDVETRGELTKGMTVVDTRPQPAGRPNARVATDVAVAEVRQYIDRILKGAT